MWNRIQDFKMEGTRSSIVEKLSLCKVVFSAKLVTNLYHETQVVPVSAIHGSDHPNYFDLWADDGKYIGPPGYYGKRGDPGIGHKTGWQARTNGDPDLLELSRHPCLPVFFLTGEGNHRLLKSKQSFDASSEVHAIVKTTTWRQDVLAALYFLHFDQGAISLSLSGTDVTGIVHIGTRSMRVDIKIQPDGLKFEDHQEFAAILPAKGHLFWRKPRPYLSLSEWMTGDMAHRTICSWFGSRSG